MSLVEALPSILCTPVAPVAPAQPTESWRMSAKALPRVWSKALRPRLPRLRLRPLHRSTTFLEESPASTGSWMAPVESLPDLYSVLEGAC